MDPEGAGRKLLGRTRCGNERPVPFNPDEYAKDLSNGVFRLDGPTGLPDSYPTVTLERGSGSA